MASWGPYQSRALQPRRARDRAFVGWLVILVVTVAVLAFWAGSANAATPAKPCSLLSYAPGEHARCLLLRQAPTRRVVIPGQRGGTCTLGRPCPTAPIDGRLSQ